MVLIVPALTGWWWELDRKAYIACLVHVPCKEQALPKLLLATEVIFVIFTFPIVIPNSSGPPLKLPVPLTSTHQGAPHAILPRIIPASAGSQPRFLEHLLFSSDDAPPCSTTSSLQISHAYVPNTSFISHLFIERLLYASLCGKGWSYKGKD